jgi:hypothetical protein
MIVLNHEYSKLTLAPKSFSIFKGLSKSMFAVSNWIFQDSSCDKPKGMPYSNREWNRNSAFIMSQYELSHGNAVSGSVND